MTPEELLNKESKTMTKINFTATERKTYDGNWTADIGTFKRFGYRAQWAVVVRGCTCHENATVEHSHVISFASEKAARRMFDGWPMTAKQIAPSSCELRYDPRSRMAA